MGELSERRESTLWRVARAAMVSGATLAAFAFAFAAVPAPVGVVPSLDSMVIAVHGAGLLSALGLALGALAHPRRIGRWFAHPAVLCLGGLVAWSVVAAPFVRLPWASLLGASFGGEGALMYLDVAAIMLAVAVLSRQARAARLVAAIGVFASVVLPPVFRFAVAAPAPEIIPEYLAPYALMAPVFAYVLMSARLRPRWGAAAILAAAPALLLSTNVSAWVAVLGIGLPIAAICHWALRTGAFDARRVRCLAALIVPAVFVLAGVAVLLVGGLDLWRSITSRVYLWKVIASVLSDAPSIWAAGQGWGLTADAIAAHLTASGAVLWDGSWDATLRGFTHTHHFALELLLSTGMPGLLLGVGAYAALASMAPRALLPVAAGFVLATAAYQSLWFFTIGNWAAFAVAMGLLLGRPMPRHWQAAFFARGVPLAAVAAQAVALVWIVHTGLEAHKAVAFDPARNAGSISCVALAADRVHGGTVVAHATRVVVRDAFADVKSGAALDETRVRRLALLLCGLDEAASRGRTALPLLSAMNLRASLALDPELASLRVSIPGVLDEWAALSRHLVQRAPARSDAVSAYLEWEYGLGNWKTVLAASQWILSRRAEDPIGLWYAGMAVLASGDPLARAEGLSLARRALARGIERFLAIPAETKAALGAP